ncbi:MAG: FtsX-like permease family protein, partial [Acidobacteriota bacterium]
ALTVSVFGLLAVLSTSVSQRTTEIGIRQALGASLAEILRLVSRQGLVLVLTGAVIGLGLALASASWIASLLHGVAANDPLTLLVAAGGSILIALPAILVPARRATAIAPAVALRSDA